MRITDGISLVNIQSFTSFSNIALVLLLTGIGALFFHELTIREEINKASAAVIMHLCWLTSCCKVQMT